MRDGMYQRKTQLSRETSRSSGLTWTQNARFVTDQGSISVLSLTFLSCLLSFSSRLFSPSLPSLFLSLSCAENAESSGHEPDAQAYWWSAPFVRGTHQTQ